MKKSIMLMWLLALAAVVIAQSDNDKWRGTWQWVSGADTFTIQLQKETIHAPTGDIIDCIVGWHRYVKNGIEIENSMQHTGTAWAMGKHTIMGGLDGSAKLYLTTVRDITLAKRVEAVLTINPSYTQALWVLREPRGIRIVDSNAPPRGTFTLPKELTLTKL